jgi:hypothetical protein
VRPKVEQDHHGFPSFRVQNRIFATLPNPHLLRVFGLTSTLRCLSEVVDDYLTEAWSDRAPKALLDEPDQRLAIDHETKPWVLD